MRFLPTKKQLFALHGWLGIMLGLPLFIICFSGACAVLSPEIDRAIHPDMRVSPPDDSAAPLPWGTLMGKVEAASPGGEVFVISASESPATAWSALVLYGGRDSRIVLINPFTGEVTGQRTPFNAQSFFRIFHKQFYIIGGDFLPHGRLIVCSFSIVLLLCALTGLMFYKGWWKHLFRIRPGKGRRILLSDTHRFIGVWTFLLAILFSVTGFWYLLERLGEDFDIREHDPIPKVSEEIRAARPPLVSRLPLDGLVEKARAAYPGLEITSIFPGNRPGGVIGFLGDGPAVLAAPHSDNVFLDPHTGGVVQVGKAHEAALAARLESMVNPLHFGRFGGLFTKTVWAAAGFLLAIGILAGAWINWLRTRNTRGIPTRSHRICSRASLLLNLAILLYAAISTFLFISAQVKGPLATQPGILLNSATVGPWEVTAIHQGKTTLFRFNGEAEPNFRAAYAWTGDGERPPRAKPLKGSSRSFSALLPDLGSIHFQAEAWDGSLHSATFRKHSRSETLFTPPLPPSVPAALWVIVAVFFTLTLLPSVFWMVKVR